MIEIKFTGATMRDVLDQIRDLVTYEEALPADAPAHPEQPPAPADKPKRERKKADAAGNGAAAPTSPPPASAGKPIEVPAASAPALKLTDAQAALTKFFEKNGLGPSRELLQQFGVGKVQELQPEQFADFITKAAV